MLYWTQIRRYFAQTSARRPRAATAACRLVCSPIVDIEACFSSKSNYFSGREGRNGEEYVRKKPIRGRLARQLRTPLRLAGNGGFARMEGDAAAWFGDGAVEVGLVAQTVTGGARDSSECGPGWGRGADRSGAVVRTEVGPWCGPEWGRGADRSGAAVRIGVGRGADRSEAVVIFRPGAKWKRASGGTALKRPQSGDFV